MERGNEECQFREGRAAVLSGVVRESDIWARPEGMREWP